MKNHYMGKRQIKNHHTVDETNDPSGSETNTPK